MVECRLNSLLSLYIHSSTLPEMVPYQLQQVICPQFVHRHIMMVLPWNDGHNNIRCQAAVLHVLPSVSAVVK